MLSGRLLFMSNQVGGVNSIFVEHIPAHWRASSSSDILTCKHHIVKHGAQRIGSCEGEDISILEFP